MTDPMTTDTAPAAHWQLLARTMDETLMLLDELSDRIDRLDAALLGGQPPEIAEAAALLETGLADSHPQLMRFAQALGVTGEGQLGPLALRLHRSPLPELGPRLDRITAMLRRLASRSAAGLRRAESLGAGLTASLHALRAMDVIGTDQLLAEA